jgi:IMP dehydrogenase
VTEGKIPPKVRDYFKAIAVNGNPYKLPQAERGIFLYEGAKELAECGAVSIKVGVGPGSVCSTRVQTGNGVPQLTAIMECRAAVDDYHKSNTSSMRPTIIADGGIRTSGDIAKALAAGATAVMLGNMLSGTEETPGEVLAFETNNGYLRYYANYKEAPEALWHKKYRGSASLDSYKVQNKVASHRAPEGEATLVKYKGPVKNVLQTISGGLKSAFSYVNARNIDEFRENATLVRVTTNGASESKAS